MKKIFIAGAVLCLLFAGPIAKAQEATTPAPEKTGDQPSAPSPQPDAAKPAAAAPSTPPQPEPAPPAAKTPPAATPPPASPNPKPEAPPAPATTPSSDDYTVGPKDEMEIAILGEPGSGKQVIVSETGMIDFDQVKDVYVAGLNLAQVRDKLVQELSTYYVKPVIYLRVTAYKSKEVQILGAIANPGTIYLEANYSTVIDMISKANGAGLSRGAVAYVYRGAIPKLHEYQAQLSQAGKQGAVTPEQHLEVLKDVEKIEVDLRALLDEGDPTKNIRILPGDVIIISSKDVEIESNHIWLSGEVMKPGRMIWAPGMTIVMAITDGGGVTDLASPNRTKITRMRPDGTEEIIPIKLKDILNNKAPDIKVQPGDKIHVPQSRI